MIAAILPLAVAVAVTVILAVRAARRPHRHPLEGPWECHPLVEHADTPDRWRTR